MNEERIKELERNVERLTNVVEGMLKTQKTIIKIIKKIFSKILI